MSYILQKVTIASGKATLAGTLTLPQGNGPHPACLLLHGSGPLDRDENVPGQKLNVFNAIADHLASNGIATLRYDKRGCGKSTGVYLETGHHDLVDDATAAFDFLTQANGCDPNRCFALGHSEGTVILPQLSARRPSLRGGVLLCPFVDPIEDTLLAQAEHMEFGLRDMAAPKRWLYRLLISYGMDVRTGQRKLIARVKASNKNVLRIGFKKLEAKAFRELLALDPPALFRHVQCPLLAISGAKDVQCKPEDAQRIAEIAATAVEAHCIPDLTHILRRTPDLPSIFDYGPLLAQPIDEEVLNCISTWLIWKAAVREQNTHHE